MMLYRHMGRNWAEYDLPIGGSYSLSGQTLLRGYYRGEGERAFCEGKPRKLKYPPLEIAMGSPSRTF
jgi:hypothetical protein